MIVASVHRAEICPGCCWCLPCSCGEIKRSVCFSAASRRHADYNRTHSDCCSSVRHLVPIVVSTVVNRSSCLLLVSRAPTNRRHPFFVSATCEREPSVPCCFRARDYCSVGVQDFLELSIHLISMRDICCCICCNGFIARFIADRNVTDDRR